MCVATEAWATEITAANGIGKGATTDAATARTGNTHACTPAHALATHTHAHPHTHASAAVSTAGAARSVTPYTFTYYGVGSRWCRMDGNVLRVSQTDSTFDFLIFNKIRPTTLHVDYGTYIHMLPRVVWIENVGRVSLRDQCAQPTNSHISLAYLQR
jgi:hypothetical protein